MAQAYYCPIKEPNPNDPTQIVYRSQYPFSSPGKISGCICSDGKRRTAVITGASDTFFSTPAAVTVYRNGKRATVTGYVTQENGRWQFRQNLYGRNAAWLPLWADTERLLASGRVIDAQRAQEVTP